MHLERSAELRFGVFAGWMSGLKMNEGPYQKVVQFAWYGRCQAAFVNAPNRSSALQSNGSGLNPYRTSSNANPFKYSVSGMEGMIG
jgi:hypothetical protein